MSQMHINGIGPPQAQVCFWSHTSDPLCLVLVTFTLWHTLCYFCRSNIQGLVNPFCKSHWLDE